MAAWSYSALSDFFNCPRSYQLKRVTKECKTVETDAIRHGVEVHKHLELRVANKTPLPPQLMWMERAIANLESSGEATAEQQLAITEGFKETSWFAKDVWLRAIFDLAVRSPGRSIIADYKGLPLDTDIPTPTGFVQMQNLREGDTVFGSDGEQYSVVSKSAVHFRPCFKVAFDDTSEVICDDEHMWSTHDGRVVSVKDLKTSDLVNVSAPVKIADIPLPIDPYVLGVWLAGGKHTSAEISKPDQGIWEEIKRRGYEISHDYSAKTGSGKCQVHTVLNIRGVLNRLGVLGNKHIPNEYLFAGYQQRLDLLRGLMDGDGSANPRRKQCVFSSCDERLSNQVAELLSSLGQRPLVNACTARGFGLTVRVFPVSFRPNGINPFLLPRKADKVQSGWGRGESWRRRVVSVSAVDMVPTQCISVDSPDNTYLCTRKFIPTHNTGKRRFDNDQLMLFAGVEMAMNQEVEEVRTAFIWIKDAKVDTETYTRADIPNIWNHFLPRVEKLNNAFATDTWPERVSGLCTWCPARRSQCKHAKN